MPSGKMACHCPNLYFQLPENETFTWFVKRVAADQILLLMDLQAKAPKCKRRHRNALRPKSGLYPKPRRQYRNEK